MNPNHYFLSPLYAYYSTLFIENHWYQPNFIIDGLLQIVLLNFVMGNLFRVLSYARLLEHLSNEIELNVNHKHRLQFNSNLCNMKLLLTRV